MATVNIKSRHLAIHAHYCGYVPAGGQQPGEAGRYVSPTSGRRVATHFRRLKGLAHRFVWATTVEWHPVLFRAKRLEDRSYEIPIDPRTCEYNIDLIEAAAIEQLEKMQGDVVLYDPAGAPRWFKFNGVVRRRVRDDERVRPGDIMVNGFVVVMHSATARASDVRRPIFRL